MKAQLIVETIKALISLGCPGTEWMNEQMQYKIITPQFGTTLLYTYQYDELSNEQKLEWLRNKEASLKQEIATEKKCTEEKEKLRKLLWGKK